MEPAELDSALDELEVRLERLRALYDQYFLGIEKLEPLIARKDVDRRIYVLRREKIRNTGRRFKFQTLVQRYNTFQQYWQRVVREIENGTYRRHVLRAERTVGPTELLTVAARRRFGKEREKKQELEEAKASSALRAPDAQKEPESDSQAPAWPGFSEPQPLAAVAESPPPAPTPPSTPASVPAQQPQRPAPAPRPTKTQPPARSLESLELDMDFMGDWDPAALASAPRPVAPPEPIPQPPPAPRTRPFNPAPLPPPQAPAPPRQPEPEPSKLSDPRARRLAPPPKPSGRQPDPPAPGAPATPPAARPPAPTPTPPSPPAAPAPPPPSPPTAAADVPSPAGEGARPPRRRQRSTHPGLGPAPAGTPAPQAPAAARPTGTSSLNEERLRALHSKLLEESRRTNAPEVTLASMAKSLRAVEAKLRQEHGANRRIDFEVILRNGKPAIKPIVR